MNYNKVILAGNFTREPELQYTRNGTAVCKIGLAVNRTYVNDQNEKVQETTFVDVTAWGRTAEAIGQHFHKGSPIFIEGRLHLETWTDKATNSPRSKLTVVADKFEFPERKASSTSDNTEPPRGNPPPQRQAPRTAPAPRQAPPEDFGDGPITDGMDDEIPF